ncbi:MAG: hypothetical protein Q8L10_01260 [Candidatus Moranbacteria bacterium]|nr:hypothetical protein [Candidatus Moranbacteria bacterium]
MRQKKAKTGIKLPAKSVMREAVNEVITFFQEYKGYYYVPRL